MSSQTGITSMQRVLQALSHQEPDRVPFFLLLTTHGARATGTSIRDYFLDAPAIAEGQWMMRERYGHDCLYAFTYAAVETEAWGATVDFVEDGPPNAASLVITKPEDIDRLKVPDIATAASLSRNLEAIRLMKERAGDEVPIIGVVMAPFSLPVMQMGFASWLDLMHEDRVRYDKLIAINQEFCTGWANAQLQAGATAICYFDPVAGTDMVPRELYRELAYPVACRTIAAINGPTATHFASGRCLGLTDLVAETGTAMIGISVLDDPAEAKRRCRGKLTVFGNLDSVSMRRWTREDAEREVKDVIRAAAAGGGFVLSDNHGEIHYSVDETVLDHVADAVRTWGSYPIRSLPVQTQD